MFKVTKSKGLKGIFPYFYKQICVGCATGTLNIGHLADSAKFEHGNI
jgi:hypothetical protein